MRQRVLTIEAPDTEALVDFIDHCGVTITLDSGVLRINVKATHGPDASTWDEHDFEVTLPQQDEV